MKGTALEKSYVERTATLSETAETPLAGTKSPSQACATCHLLCIHSVPSPPSRARHPEAGPLLQVMGAQTTRPRASGLLGIQGLPPLVTLRRPGSCPSGGLWPSSLASRVLCRGNCGAPRGSMAVVPAPLLSDVPPRSLGLAASAASAPEAAPAVAPTALVAHPATGPPDHLPVQGTSPRPAAAPPSLSTPAVAAEPSLPGPRPPPRPRVAPRGPVRPSAHVACSVLRGLPRPQGPRGCSKPLPGPCWMLPGWTRGPPCPWRLPAAASSPLAVGIGFCPLSVPTPVPQTL